MPVANDQRTSMLRTLMQTPGLSPPIVEEEEIGQMIPCVDSKRAEKRKDEDSDLG